MSPKEKKDKLLTYSQFLAEVAKKHGGHVISQETEVQVMRSGFPALDEALGVGGYPRGRIIMTYGEQGVGKTLTKMVTAAGVQKVQSVHGKHGGRVAWVDIEHAFSYSLAAIAGMKVDRDHFIHFKPSSGEEALDIILEAIWTGPDLTNQGKKITHYGDPRRLFDMIVLDSAAALVGDDEIKDKRRMASVAAMLSTFCKQVVHWLDASGTTLFIINQTRANPDIFMGNPNEPTGGKAIMFYSSIVEKVKRAEWLKEGADKKTAKKVGTRNEILVEKNKVAPPFQKALYDYRFQGGLSKIAQLVDVAIQKGIVKYSGKGGCVWKDKKWGNKDVFVESIGGSYDLLLELEEAVSGTSQISAPPALPSGDPKGDPDGDQASVDSGKSPVKPKGRRGGWPKGKKRGKQQKGK